MDLKSTIVDQLGSLNLAVTGMSEAEWQTAIL